MEDSSWILGSDWSFGETPSRADGMSVERENVYRAKTVWFIEELGKELKW